MVDELNASGVSMCHIDELFEDRGLWSESSPPKYAHLARSDEVQSVVRKRQQDFAQTQDFAAVQHYIVTKYSQDRKPLITSSDTLLRFGVNSLVLDVANSYLGLWSKLIYFDMWYTLPLRRRRDFSHSAGIAIQKIAGRSALFCTSVELMWRRRDGVSPR